MEQQTLPSRRSEYDVTNRVNTTQPPAVRDEVCRLYLALYPGAQLDTLSRAFADCARLYRGEYPGYRACDTAYHNLQHTMDVALAMARLMDGYERAPERGEPIGPRLYRFGVMTALFHDIGYLRHRHDSRHRNGAEYTLCHVSRGSRFIEQYLTELGMHDLAPVAAHILHFTGYEIPVPQIEVPDEMFLRIGQMLGAADIIAQMSDRCYLEKCRDRLYPEFVAGGIAVGGSAKTVPPARFTSVEDLLRQTPNFYLEASHRLNAQLGAAHGYATSHFGGQNLYLQAVLKNVEHAERVAREADLAAMLRRRPPPDGNAAGADAGEQRQALSSRQVNAAASA